MSCACDACEDPSTPIETSGYCGFCSQNCYPSGVLGNRTVKLVMSPRSRKDIHAIDRGEIPVISPLDPREIAREAGRKIVDSAFDAAKPLAKQAMQEGLKYLRRRLNGSG